MYLGSLLSSAGSVNNDVKLEIQKREKHFNKFYSFLRENYNAPLFVKEQVLDACVSSAILYNCETWGNADVKQLEMMYRKALKYMLGVRATNCNEFPYVELGKSTLTSLIHKRQYIFFKKCTVDSDWPLQRHIIRTAMDARCPFIAHYTRLVHTYTSAESIIQQSLQKLKSDIIAKANKLQSRYISYQKINPTLSKPNIYNTIIPTFKQQLTSRLRMISHDLAIEIGRHKRPKVPIARRICECGDIETEKHFVLNCHQYSHIRRKYNVTNSSVINFVLDTDFTCDFITDLQEN